MSRSKLILITLVALIVAFGLGYAFGVSGRSAAEKALAAGQQQLDLSDTTSHLLNARVSLYNNNFGDASRSFEEAKIPLRRLRERYDDEGRRNAVSSIDAALQKVDEAQRLAGHLDHAANSKADDALKALEAANRER